MTVVIFLGPSLSLDRAKEILPDAIYLPPAGQADLISAVTIYEPSVIGLIDGVFLQSLSVWHKEILYALERGIAVYGASSMGALRASETDRYGMVGIGQVYQMYADGDINDDDEVALAHGIAEHNYVKLSEPMVNIRATLEAAVASDQIDNATAETIIDVSKQLYFPDRRLDAIWQGCIEAGLSEETISVLKRIFKEAYVDIKAQDAISLLKHIRDHPVSEVPVPEFEMQRTHLFDALFDRDRSVQRSGGRVTQSRIATYTALHLPDFLDFNFHALNMGLAEVLADFLDVGVTEKEFKAEKRRLTIRHKLKTDEQLNAWMKENDLTSETFGTFIQQLARIRKLHHWLVTRRHLKGSVQLVLNLLRYQNRYAEWADRAAEHEALFNEHYPLFLQEDHSQWLIEKLLTEHLLRTDCRMDVHYPIWLEESGFENAQHLWMELLRAKLVRDLKDNEPGD